MKMSDLFQNPIEFYLNDAGFVYCKYNQIGTEQVDYIENATINHDRLEQENSELREFKEKALKCLDYTLNWAPASWQAQTVEDLLESQKQSEEKAKQLLNK